MKLNSKTKRISGLFMIMLVVSMILVTPVIANPAGKTCENSIVKSNISAEESNNRSKMDINITALKGHERSKVLDNLLAKNKASQVDYYTKKNGFKQNLSQAKAYVVTVTNNSSVGNIQSVTIPINTGKKNLDAFKLLLSSGNLKANYIRVNGTSDYFPNTMNILENDVSYKKLKANFTESGYKITALSVTEVIGQTVDSSTFVNNSSIEDYAVVSLKATNCTTSKPITATVDMNSKKVVLSASSSGSCEACKLAAGLVCGIPLTLLTIGGCLAACAYVGESCAPYCVGLVSLAVNGACQYGSWSMCKKLRYCS